MSPDGLAGLGGAGVTAGQAGHAPVIAGRALVGLASALWLVSVGWYLLCRTGLGGPPVEPAGRQGGGVR
ncbi:hypothetical protein ACFZCY_37430 [Streptomyces sp. NPDC007983]|uniref:hypothetical protein n=1 Tax=Streptomyces sp. NPDC007983 TaxID=3364800 RepID=UPI0036EF2A01